MVDAAGSVGGVVSPVLQVAEWLAAPICRQFKYLFNYKCNFDNLQEEVDKLKNTRDEVQHKVTDAERNVEEIKQNVKDWQKKVEKTITEAEQLIQAKANNPRCFNGLCRNFITSYKQSKKAFKLKRDDIDPLLRQEKELGPVSYPTNPPEIWLRSSENYVDFESRNSTVNNVWDALNDENVYMIGVYGMGGLGKTTLVQELGRKAKKEKVFEEIVFVEVSESPDVKKIQTTIADNLGVKFKNESDMAKQVYSRMKDKNILLILDNIWEPLEFDNMIGIPREIDRGRNKLLLTTRDLDVLEKMGSTNNFTMGILNEEDAWNLFAKMADIFAGNVIKTHRLHSLPNDVCKECGGLPIIICTMAKALKNKSHPSDWKVALQELRAPSPTKFTGFLKKDYMKIALSYKYLRDDELKETFLIASLLENNTSISDLLRHVMCLDILEGANLTIEDARNRLDKLVRDLKDACLLLDGFKSGQFAMHDIVRDVAITIAYVDHNVFTTRNDIERDWKDRDKLRKCTKISLVSSSNIINQLWPNNLDCPNLEYFYMTNMCNSSFEIPEDFFTVMPKLRVLNLDGLQQLALPSSIDLLTNLQTLCLYGSKIKDVAIIGKLRNLKVLSLQHASIKKLPTEIGQLTQLRLLDLSYCGHLKVVASNVISKLSNLEELFLKGCPIQWKIEVLEELKLLSSLTSLELEIEDDKVLPKDFFSKELIRYKMSVGNWFEHPIIDEDEYLRVLKLKFNPAFYLEELYGIKNVELLGLSQYLDDEDKDDLEHSKFNLQSNEITLLFNKEVIFPDLMVLILKDIISRKFWHNQLPTSFFQNLKQLILWRCTKIKYVFPSTIAKSLQQLQYFEIMDCIVLEGIVATEEGTEATVNFFFPQVAKLKLHFLPEFTDFSPVIHPSTWPKLKELVVIRCHKFKMLLSEPISLCLDQQINHDLKIFLLTDGLQEIGWRSQSKDKDLKISNYESAHIPFGLFPRFENLTFLYVDRCHEFVNLTTPSIARSLVQLRELKVSYCQMLMEILEIEEDATTEIVFESLSKLSFEWIESLTCFCSGNYTFNFPSLEELNITKCPHMKTFCRGILCTPKLQKINYDKMKVENKGNDLNKTIQGLYKRKNQNISLDLKLLTLKDVNSTKICYNKHPTSLYQNLTHLFLWNCGNIKYAFPSSIAKSLHQLQQLKIRNCKVLEEIVAKEEEANAVVHFVFPNITLLKLQDLPELIAFYPGIYTIEMPKLKELEVKRCTKYLSFKENKMDTECDILDPESIFLNNVINFNLEIFDLYDHERNISWQSQSKTFAINRDTSANFPLRLLQKFENVRELRLFCSGYRDIKSVCDLPNLEVLDVWCCEGLMSLVSCLASFQNLKVLRVNLCGRLMKLITPLEIRSLVQLRELSISSCEILTEIVENEGDGTTNTKIVFNNLNKLSFKQLKSLTCFCFGNYSFSFPSLEELIIEDCPNLGIFCQGSLCTPKLDKVIYKFKDENDGEVEIGDNDLNTTIQQEYKKQNEKDFRPDGSKLQKSNGDQGASRMDDS
ncbi:probable disease resistance protein At4g27220 isoform X1 [Mangifera indica]|uniref:probable disease resistance protein At4g27220 isoform X1 n=1 Tax=Mangifera indica TaxID=29780 RepID=UPI001CFA0598|nr:probable disease resistance protein At4g27220 isoform X1 [Mangifera indica]XP_044483882.1 probable disease resistance protein At4g27220 isoform X1 [Mangifera indica]XP_044483883.1 probable disease resistance protein At4g27220 isoform X1 [Mangifera indica]XP_044483884.1 probable disease resistance protein At4g27220 isoform X1 [Mangifera indica]XP_044483885.1 probable disease resistance protein At4g27220 isoform X1 [Mangifera indica]XP_044483887.1 probable disease resistance protein At4g27220